MSDAKAHGTFAITSALLDKLSACYDRDRVADLLPFKISTDPDENAELAVAICDREGPVSRDNWEWLARVVTDSPFYELPRTDCFGETSTQRVLNDRRDPMVQQQWMAIVADAILTHKGR